MTSISDIRVFLGKEFDNYYCVDDLDQLKYFLCHDVLDRFTIYDPNETTYTHDYFDMVYSLLQTSKDIIATIPYNSEYRVNKPLIYTVCIYQFLGMLKTDKRDYWTHSVEYLKRDAKQLISYGFTELEIKEMLWILSNNLIPDINKATNCSFPFNPGNLYIVSDAIKLARLPIYDLVLTTYHEVYYTHRYNITTYDISHISQLVYLRLQSLYGYKQCNHLYLLHLILESPVYSEYNELQNILESQDTFNEYIQHYFDTTSINRGLQ